MRGVIGAANLVLRHMGKLLLDSVDRPLAAFIENCGRQPSEAVDRCAPVIAQTIQPIEHGVLADRLALVARLDPFRVACRFFQLVEDGEALRWITRGTM